MQYISLFGLLPGEFHPEATGFPPIVVTPSHKELGTVSPATHFWAVGSLTKLIRAMPYFASTVSRFRDTLDF